MLFMINILTTSDYKILHTSHHKKDVTYSSSDENSAFEDEKMPKAQAEIQHKNGDKQKKKRGRI